VLKKWEFPFLTAVGALTLVLVIVNAVLFLGNRSSQLEVNNRQQYVQQSVQLEGLYREIVKALADLSVKNNDKQIRDMLASQGITVTVGGQGAAPGGDTASQRGAGR
jgi:ABC-type transport system involved in cytochrome bd biosynthesis fused ATPase/permease subunit